MAIDLGSETLLTTNPLGYAIEDEAIRGGFRVVTTAAQVVTETRLNQLVAFGRRSRGMLVYDVTTTEIWQCTSPGTGASDGTWSQFSFPVPSIDGGSY
jgi:hypothetical protein